MNGDKIQQAKKKGFLKAFAELGVVTRAAIAASINRSTHYGWLKGDEEYAEAFEHAKEDAADSLEAEAWRRAVEGVEEPVGWFRGVPGGTVRRYSDTLLIFLLKGARPQKYRESAKQDPTAAEMWARRIMEAKAQIEASDGA